MTVKQSIRVLVFGTLVLWLFCALFPAVSVYAFQETDQITVLGTLEEEPHEESSQKELKKWVSDSFPFNYKTIIYFAFSLNVANAIHYTGPTRDIVLPPPELV